MICTYVSNWIKTNGKKLLSINVKSQLTKKDFTSSWLPLFVFIVDVYSL